MVRGLPTGANDGPAAGPRWTDARPLGRRLCRRGPIAPQGRRSEDEVRQEDAFPDPVGVQRRVLRRGRPDRR